MAKTTPHVLSVGAGIGGLAAALRLSDAGCRVTVLDRNAGPGGKMRTLPSAAGPVDAGPTVLTLRPVFEALFNDCGMRLEDHLSLRPLPVIARHYWSDGTRFDLFADRGATLAEVGAVFGPRARREFETFTDRAARLFAAFDGPMMQAATPSPARLAAHVLRQPRLVADMAPWRSLAAAARSQFSAPRLAQLFTRYATYVGGLPGQVPALLSLISDAEAQGVWAVEGGMHRLARVLEDQARARGAAFCYDTHVAAVRCRDGRAVGVTTGDRDIAADAVVFNGDPFALWSGMLGPAVTGAVRETATIPRSLSADVLAFAAQPHGIALDHHTVFFSETPEAEFGPLSRGETPADATLYLCAQDHGQVAPEALQRFEVIRNASSLTSPQTLESPACLTLILDRLAQFGLRFSPAPGPATLTRPAGFEALNPGSHGALYGRSPAGMRAAFQRPTARSRVPGLYLVGGGAHPGAGVPMATLSARHVAAAIMQDHALTLPSRRTAMPGGISTGSPTTVAGRSLS